MDIAKRILELCELNNITPNRLATLADMPYTTLQDIVSKRNQSPQVKTIEKICEGLQITLSEFFTEDKPALPLEARKMLETFEAFLHTQYPKQK